MKRFVTFLFLVFISGIYAQNDWSVTSSLPTIPYTPGPGYVNIVKAGFDTDNDGWGEFICAYSDADSNFILMYEASADNTYDLVWQWKYPVPANSFAGIVVGDLDGNGVVEIITTMPSVTDGTNPPRLWVFEWNGVTGENKYGSYSGSDFTPHSSWNFDLAANTDYRPYSLTIEDIDDDGMNELIVGVRSGDNGREVLVANVSGTFSSGFVAWNIEYQVNGWGGGSLYSVTTGDLDGDGHKEIHAMLWNLFSLRFIEVTGANTYALVNELLEIYPETDYGALDGVCVGNVNNDGSNEMYIAGTEDPNQVFCITNVTDVSTIDSTDIRNSEFYKIPAPVDGGFRSMQLADPDGDGKADLMIAGERNGRVYDLEYKGSGDPADSANWDLNIAFDLFEECAADLGITADSAANLLTPRLFYGHITENDMDQDGHNEYVVINWSPDIGSWANDQELWVVENGVASGFTFDGNRIPKQIVLRQNYPNPFNPETKIPYTLQTASDVSIVIYDLLGQKVRTLVNEFKAAGDYETQWNGLTDAGSQAASGVYIYKLITKDKQISKRMNLIR